MNTDRQLMQQAFDAMSYGNAAERETARIALRDRLEQPEQEPVLQEIEQYRMQMAGISTAAIGYWKEGDNIHPEYDTIALRDVAKLYAKYDALYKAQPEQERVGDDWTPCIKLPVVVHVRKQRLGETHVSTREGITPVKPDDLIMRGVSGEEYPIGRAIFEQTYSLNTTPPQRKPEQDVPEASCGNMEPVGWLESPDGAFRANPLYKIQFPSQLLSWQIPVFAALAEPAEPVQEPFGYLWPTGRHPEFRFTQQKRDGVDGMPLYTAPPQRKEQA